MSIDAGGALGFEGEGDDQQSDRDVTSNCAASRPRNKSMRFQLRVKSRERERII